MLRTIRAGGGGGLDPTSSLKELVNLGFQVDEQTVVPDIEQLMHRMSFGMHYLDYETPGVFIENPGPLVAAQMLAIIEFQQLGCIDFPVYATNTGKGTRAEANDGRILPMSGMDEPASGH